jgi:transposase
VRGWMRAGGWRAYRRPDRPKKLAGLEEWLKAKLVQHRGNADVVRQELKDEREIEASLRMVERAVAPFRRELEAEKRATVRFETPPGKQMQIDFGTALVAIAGAKERAHVFVATLGYSRRGYVRAFRSERQGAWFDGMESAFVHFSGVPREVLFDNARALVDRHDPMTREVVFNARLHAFARYWGFQPSACAPYRARTKGKDENGVGYVKKNAIAGREFESWAAFEAHLERWTREVSDVRIHGTTGEAPIVRFERDEAQALKPHPGRPPFRDIRDLVRRVGADCCVEIDRVSYSVPWRLIGERVAVHVVNGRVRICHVGRIVAEHAEGAQRARIIDPAHLYGIVGAAKPQTCAASSPAPALLRPLEEYEAVAGGRW